MSLNRIVLQGRLGTEPELRTTPNGVEVVSLNVACDRDRKDANGKRQTDWIPIVAWRGTAKLLADHFSKGDPILVEGRLQTRSYTDKNGNKRTAFEVVADNVHFCGGSRAEQNWESYSTPNYGAPAAGAFVELDDSDGALPF